MALTLTTPRAGSVAFAKTASLTLYASVWAERRALARLTETELRDLGISPADAKREAARPFWDLPCHRG